jgi:CBS domain-containing protein
VLTSSDLLRTTAQGPVGVLRSVERLATRDALPGYGARVVEMASSLLAGGLDATVIAGFVARLNDALLSRILRWAEADLGMPPAPYAWIAFGSEGRMEQTLLTDQDNALVHGGVAADEPYFAALAERANTDLEAAGFPRQEPPLRGADPVVVVVLTRRRDGLARLSETGWAPSGRRPVASVASSR